MKVYNSTGKKYSSTKG